MTFVNIDVNTYQVREPDEHGWDGGDYDGEVGTPFIAKEDYERGYRGEETDLDPPFYVVYAGYRTGSTFGFDYEGCIVGVVKTEEEAEALQEEAREYKGFGALSNGFDVPWNGYFESLSDLHIEYLS